MSKILFSKSENFQTEFSNLITVSRGGGEEVGAVVRQIIEEVRRNGFSALQSYSRKFDSFELSLENVAVSDEELMLAEAACDAADLEALDFAAKRILDFHEKQFPENKRYIDGEGVELGWRWAPVEAAGLYVPGGRAAYPSSVLMNAIPAKVAGVSRLVMVSPASGGEINPLALAAAKRAGVTEVYRVGGAQAIAALAYGADPILPVDTIAGPGNAYVAEAKRQVYGKVGIDSIAGPSEIFVVADSDNDPAWIAADLLSQAEHDPTSQSLLVTDSDPFAKAVAKEIDAQIALSSRAEIMNAAWRTNSAIIVVESIWDEAPALVDLAAPEHLELAVSDPEALFGKIKHAGAVFLGKFTPEAIGDYVAGPDHVLPTGRTARFASGLSVIDFMKRTSIISCSEDAVRKVGPSAERLAKAEGLPGHAKSVSLRLQPRK